MNYVSQENLDNIVKGLSNKIVMSVSNGALIGDTTPVGTVISFMGTQAPLFYLVCDGTTYNIAEYQELADFIEAQFGAVNYFGGDGTTTFAVPDLRGEFLRGTGTNSHENQGNGENVGVHQDSTEMADITCANSTLYMNRDSSKNDWARLTNNIDVQIPKINTTYYHTISSTNTATTGSPSFSARPTNTSVLYCIKYTKAVIPSEYEDGTPVGRVIFDSILREGYIKANGAQIEDATIAIPRLLSFVQKYSSQLIAPDQETYEANVGLYMYDSTNDILTLPNYIGRYVAGGDSISALDAQIGTHAHVYQSFGATGSSNVEGVKNIMGGANDWPPGSTNVTLDSEFPSNWNCGVNTASASTTVASGISSLSKSGHTIYDDSGTTRPKTITMIPQIRY